VKNPIRSSSCSGKSSADSAAALSADDFPEQLLDLIGFFTGDFPPDHPYRQITATPGLGHLPALWLLGSSGYSAQVAGQLGLPFSFAHHFSSQHTVPALELYRRTFRPSEQLARPYPAIGVAVVCADTDEEARWLAAPSGLSFLRLRQGRPGPLPSPEEAAAYPYSDHEREVVADRMANQVVGSAQTVRADLEALIERTSTAELIITTMIHDPAARIRSYELVAELAGLPGLAGTAAERP